MANEIKDDGASDKGTDKDIDILDEDLDEGQDDLKDKDNPDSGDKDKADPDKGDAPKESLEDRRARLARQLERIDKKLGKVKDEPKSNKSDEMGYGEKAFLVASGIKGEQEMNLVKQIAKETGKTYEAVLESKYFQAELKEIREQNASKAAQYKAGRKSGDSSKETVEYWLAEGKLPPEDQVELRRKVVNARAAKEGTGSPFTKTPIA